jgi:hypothetical protein
LHFYLNIFYGVEVKKLKRSVELSAYCMSWLE